MGFVFVDFVVVVFFPKFPVLASFERDPSVSVREGFAEGTGAVAAMFNPGLVQAVC